MSKSYESRIKALLDEMTLEEKVGQLNQCGPSLVGAFEVSFEELLDMMFDGKISQSEFEHLMNTAKQDFKEDALRAGKIGSYNGVGDAKTANRLQQIAVEESRLSIPLLFGYDVIHGFETVTPIPLAESCAWEPKLWQKTARLAAEEATAGGVHMTFAPMVDVAKDARWGRISEGAGEDILLNAAYGAAKVKGFQGEDLTKPDALAACVKHFSGYGAVEAGKDYNRVDMSMQRLYEEYLPSYQACIEAGARAVMPAFNDINGVPCTVNGWLLKKILRDDWGFDGMTISDANAVAESVAHGVAKNEKEAAKMALLAGTEMDMTSGVYEKYLIDLLQTGAIEMETLDQAVANVLRVKFELGLFEHPYKTNEEREKKTRMQEKGRKLAREAAVKSCVLLKNEEKLLPLRSNVQIGIFGVLSEQKAEMTGAWSIKADPESCISITQACEMRGVPYHYHSGELTEQEKILAIAEAVDVILVSIGEHKTESGEAASKADITLAQEQISLLKLLSQTKKPVIAVVFSGRPLVLTPAVQYATAILQAWHLGAEAGTAILDLLYGDANPTGKLTTTFPHASGQCPIYYAHINTGRPGKRSKFTSKYLDTPLKPLFPFGYGLSYTEYMYRDLKVFNEEQGFRITVKVKNIGDRAGDEIIQCYVQDVVAQRARPVKELKAFTKKTIDIGEEITVEFTLPYQKLGYYDAAMNYIVETGHFKFYVGGNVNDVLEYTAEYHESHSVGILS